ncbi:MAG: S41 family peptidase [Magnetospirillum sp. WYHS-4]
MSWNRLSRALVLAASFAAGAVLPSLVGCSGGDSPFAVGRVAGLFSGDALSLDAEGERQLKRFEETYRGYVKPKDDGQAGRQLKHFSDAFKRVRANYVHPVADRELIEAAIKGVKDKNPDPKSMDPAVLVETALDAMLTSLDPHSGYLNPDEFKEVGVATKGEFGGLGIEVSSEDGYVKVIAPMEETPAARAGIKTGDLITHLDGQSIKDIQLADAVKRMRGKPGTKIRLTVKRGEQAPFDVTLIRAVIEVKAARWRLEGDVGYLRVTRFNAKLEETVSQAIDDIRAKAGGKLRGMVLDLRNNPGGLLDQSVALADAFLDHGTVVSVRGRDKDDSRSYDAGGGDAAPGLPLVVLINGGSASASEIVAGALQDQRRAVVMGTRSFGKGSVQTILPLPVEGGLRLTTQLYYTPSGRAIQALGVEPDIAVTSPEDPEKQAKRRREADLPHAIPAQNEAASRTRATLAEADCPLAKDGDKEDRMLGCALDLVRAGSAEAYLSHRRTAQKF